MGGAPSISYIILSFIIDPEAVAWFIGGQFVLALLAWLFIIFRK